MLVMIYIDGEGFYKMIVFNILLNIVKLAQMNDY